MNRGFNRRRLIAASGGLALAGGLGRAELAWGTTRFTGNPFSLGIAAGDPWPDGFVIWTRLAPEPMQPRGGMTDAAVPVRWEVAEDEGFTRIARSGETLARPELAHSVHVEVSGLQSWRPYWYRFRVEGADVSPVGKARTAPAAGAIPEKARLALAGCQAYPQGWFDAWGHIAREPDLDAVFHYGDYIYEYGVSRMVIRDASGRVVDRQHQGEEVYTLDEYRHRYAQYKSDPHLQAAHAAAAFIMSFDDHEVDNDWASDFDQDGTPPETFARRRYAAMQAWYEHMPVRRAQFPRIDGLTMYRRIDYGDLFRMHVLDTRSYRSDQLCMTRDERNCRISDDPPGTILGAAQEAWLDEGLRTSDARWNLIAQQVRVMPLKRRAPDRSFMPIPTDGWSGYPASRARLVQSIRDARLSNVVIATGDAHMHNIGAVPFRDDEPDGPAAAIEFMATSISSGGDGAATTPATQAYLDARNPNLALINHQRGYQVFNIGATEWVTDVKVMDQVQKPGGRIGALTRFAVESSQA